jgi:TM2 domain-containing membrane protein YozV
MPRVVAVSPDDGSAIDLRNPALAAVLGWLVPGLGHLYQGRRLKGWLFMASILATFFLGWWIGGGRVVFWMWQPGDRRVAFIGQAGIGIAAIPALVQARLLEGARREPFAASQWFAPPIRMRQFVSARYAARLVDTEPAIEADDFFDRPPLKQFRGDQLAIWQYELGRLYDIGTLYTMLAGMLNMLVVFDAWAGPMSAGSKESREKAQAAEQDKESAE